MRCSISTKPAQLLATLLLLMPTTSCGQQAAEPLSALTPQRSSLVDAYSRSVYAVGFGPLTTAGEGSITLLEAALLGARGLQLKAIYAADLNERPGSTHAVVAAGDVMERFPFTAWRPATQGSISPGALASTVFVVEVQPAGVGVSSFEAVELRYEDGRGRVGRSTVPISFMLTVKYNGEDPRAHIIEGPGPN